MFSGQLSEELSDKFGDLRFPQTLEEAGSLLFNVFFVSFWIWFFFLRGRRKWKAEKAIKKRWQTAAAEIEQLHKELIEKGVPAEAKVLKRWSDGWAVSNYFYMIAEIDRGDNFPPYQVKKYRPWMPERLLDINGRYEKPYKWHFEDQDYRALFAGAVLPIRVHPEIPDLFDFEVNFYDSDALPKTGNPQFVISGNTALRLNPWEKICPDDFERWKRGEPETLPTRNSLEPLPKSFRFASLFKISKKGSKQTTLISQLQHELRTDGIRAKAKIINYSRLAVTQRDHSSNLDPHRVLLELEVELPDGKLHKVEKHRPWEDIKCSWYFPEPFMCKIEPGAVFPVVVHPRIPDILDFEFYINSEWNQGYTGYDRDYSKEAFDIWQQEAKQKG